MSIDLAALDFSSLTHEVITGPDRLPKRVPVICRYIERLPDGRINIDVQGYRQHIQRLDDELMASRAALPGNDR